MAPALIASYRSASSSLIVSMMIRALGTASLIAVQASMPPRRGIRTSMHDVGQGVGGLAYRLGAVTGLADDLDVRLLLEHHLQLSLIHISEPTRLLSIS